ncbi:MAG: HCO3- transporter, partial [Planctomycetota bacterium]|nr:HCO3- transporter [Planctomycetota bacterium]
VVLYQFCDAMDIEFLPFYGWVGIWAGLFTIVLAVTDSSVIIKHLTRFTNEIFVVLIAGIYIYSALELLVKEFETDALISYSTALSALVLALGTFAIVVGMRTIRKGGFLRAWARDFLADFGAVIAIATMSGIAYFMRDTTSLAHIEIPTKVSFNPADYLVNIFELPVWGIALAVVPAIFATCLIFLDQQITARVVNAPQHNLRKGPGYHLDLAIIGVLVMICSVFRLPWLVAATIRSLNHLNILSTTHTEAEVGKTTEVMDRVIENRLSGFFVHLLIGCSIALAPFLALVPQACLYGLFLYMGIVLLGGVQFFDRLTLWIRDPKRYPRTHYLRNVPMLSVHIFTAIQLVCFVCLWVIKSGPPMVALLFPVLLFLMVPIRMLLGKFFDPKYLEALDSEESLEEEPEW